MAEGKRERELVHRLLDEYRPSPEGSVVDSDRVRQIVTAEPDLIAAVFPALLRWNRENQVGIWGLLHVVAQQYEVELQDDSLNLLLAKAAHEAGVTLPKVKSFRAHADSSGERAKVINLQMARDDVIAGDAHRVLTLMRLETMSPDVRQRMLGKCVISLPFDDDPRAIQKIPEVRRFVADLQRRMPYFPVFLNFDPVYSMHFVYFGCLADQRATVVNGTQVRVNLLDQSLVLCMKQAMQAVRAACQPLGLDWKPAVRSIGAVFDRDTRRHLFGSLGDL